MESRLGTRYCDLGAAGSHLYRTCSQAPDVGQTRFGAETFEVTRTTVGGAIGRMSPIANRKNRYDVYSTGRRYKTVFGGTVLNSLADLTLGYEAGVRQVSHDGRVLRMRLR